MESGSVKRGDKMMIGLEEGDHRVRIREERGTEGGREREDHMLFGIVKGDVLDRIREERGTECGRERKPEAGLIWL